LYLSHCSNFDKTFLHWRLCCGAFVQHTQTKPRKVSQKRIISWSKSRGSFMRHGNQGFRSLVSIHLHAAIFVHQKRVFQRVPRETYGITTIVQHSITSDSFVTPAQQVLANCVNRSPARSLRKWMPMFTKLWNAAAILCAFSRAMAGHTAHSRPKAGPSHERSIAMRTDHHHTTTLSSLAARSLDRRSHWC